MKDDLLLIVIEALLTLAQMFLIVMVAEAFGFLAGSLLDRIGTYAPGAWYALTGVRCEMYEVGSLVGFIMGD